MEARPLLCPLGEATTTTKNYPFTLLTQNAAASRCLVLQCHLYKH